MNVDVGPDPFVKDCLAAFVRVRLELRQSRPFTKVSPTLHSLCTVITFDPKPYVTIDRRLRILGTVLEIAEDDQFAHRANPKLPRMKNTLRCRSLKFIFASLTIADIPLRLKAEVYESCCGLFQPTAPPLGSFCKHVTR